MAGEYEQKVKDILGGKITDPSVITEVLRQSDDNTFIEIFNHLSFRLQEDLLEKMSPERQKLMSDYVQSKYSRDVVDVMSGKITDPDKISAVLAKVDDQVFVDVLDKMDRDFGHEIVDKLPEEKQQLLNSYMATKSVMSAEKMARNMEQENELWKVDAEEYVKNSENLDKWKVDLKSDEFKEGRDVADWMNVDDDVKNILMETAVQKAKEDSRNTKGLTEAQYKEAINYEIQVAVYTAMMVSSGYQDLLEGKNPKISIQKAVQKFVAEGHKKNSIDVGYDAIAAYSAKTHEWIGHRRDAALAMFRGTKVGAKVEKISKAISKELGELDAKISKNKYLAKPYQVAKKIAPIMGKMARGAAVSVGMIALVHASPMFIPVYGVYAAVKTTKKLRCDYEKDKKKNPNLNFCQHMSNNKMEVLKSAASFANMMVSGCMGYGALGLNNLATRGAIAATMGAINTAALHIRDKKEVKELRAKGEEVKDASLWNATKKGIGLSLGSFLAGLALKEWVPGFLGDGHHGDTGLENPEDVKARLEANNGASVAARDSTNVVSDSTKVETDSVSHVVAPDANTYLGGSEETDAFIRSRLVDDCNCSTQENIPVNAHDCEAKIALQERAPESDADMKFWISRSDMFVDKCEQQDLSALIAAKKINLADFPGIHSEAELTYKFGLMRRMNLPSQRGMVEEIQNMLDDVKNIRCSGGNEAEHVAAFQNMHPMHPDMAKAIANGMNSYDDRGNYLCEDLSNTQAHVDTMPVQEATKVEATPEPKPEPVQTPKVEQVEIQPVPEDFVVSGQCQESVTVYKHLIGKDYDRWVEDRASLDPKNAINGTFSPDDLGLAAGGISYTFNHGSLTMDYDLPATEDVKMCAEHIAQNRPDIEDPQQKAVEMIAKLHVYTDLYNQDQDQAQTIPGLGEWTRSLSDDLQKCGLKYNSETGELLYKQTENVEQVSRQTETVSMTSQTEVVSGKDYNMKGNTAASRSGQNAEDLQNDMAKRIAQRLAQREC